MRTMGTPTYFLGMNIAYNRESGKIFLSQHTYVDKILERFEMQYCVPTSLPIIPTVKLTRDQGSSNPTNQPYSSLVGALLFLAVCTRPDIAFAVHTLSKFLTNPAEQHWETAINLLRYIKGTKFFGITLGKSTIRTLVSYSDADWANDSEDRKSISGGVLLWGSSILQWFAKKQQMIATSTVESESHALLLNSYAIIRLERLINEILSFTKQPVVEYQDRIIFVDNQPAIQMISNGKARTKHYDVKFRFVGECIENKIFMVKKISTKDNLGDIFTKALSKNLFFKFRSALVSTNG